MKKLIFVSVIGAAMFGLWLAGCKKDTISPDAPRPISFKVPDGWPQPGYSFANNPLTQSGFELGRKLFYDMRLSRDNSVSCGSCHQQFSAFANLEHATSHGINGLLGTRNAPGLSNIAWHHSYFWDGGANNLEVQPIGPIQNHVEMDMTLQEVVDKVAAIADYKGRFSAAFGDDGVTSQRILKALAQFMGAMVSSDSRYDRYVAGISGGVLTESEINGLTLFRQKCSNCHVEPLFSDYSYRNNGIHPSAVNDSGRGHVTKDAADNYKFKVPSLRDVALTAPYMHDGRFATLEAVLEHYRHGVTGSPTLDPSLAEGIMMTDAEKKDIIAFLKTLTDTTFIKDKRFADPL